MSHTLDGESVHSFVSRLEKALKRHSLSPDGRGAIVDSVTGQSSSDGTFGVHVRFHSAVSGEQHEDSIPAVRDYLARNDIATAEDLADFWMPDLDEMVLTGPEPA